jgi:predicted dehydrogenase
MAGSPAVRLELCCDDDASRAVALARQCQCERTTDDWRQAIGDPAVDAVIIATTTHTHADIAIAAAEAGKHILVEKPMATTVQDCLAIERAADAAGVMLMIGFKFRFAPAMRAARAAVPSPILLVTQTLYDASQNTAGWLNDRRQSGGRLTSSLVHSVDALRYLSGSEPAYVSATGAALAVEGLTEPDNVAACITFENGTIASLVHGSAGQSDLLSVWSFQSVGIGTNATVYDHARRMTLHDATSSGGPTEVATSVEDPFQSGMPELIEAFAAAVVSGHVEDATGRDGTIAVALCRDIETAIETQQTQPATTTFS